MSKRKITIFGGGAVGAIFAAYFVRAGLSVTVVDQWQEHVEAMREGLIIDGCRGQFITPLNAIITEELKGPLDLVFLAVKSGSTVTALETLRPLLADSSTVVTLQNGINEDVISTAIGAHRTMGCVVGWGATSVKPGHITQTSQGKLVLGNVEHKIDDRVCEIQDILSTICQCCVTDNLYGFRWLKLMGNCSIAACTILGKTVGEALAVNEMKPIIEAVIYEGLEVAAKAGVSLETLSQKFTPLQYIALKGFIAEAIIELLKTEHSKIFPAFYQDILKGRKSEIDYINGCIVSKGSDLGVPTPVNNVVVRVIHEFEEKRRSVGPENLELFRPYIG